MSRFRTLFVLLIAALAMSYAVGASAATITCEQSHVTAGNAGCADPHRMDTGRAMCGVPCVAVEPAFAMMAVPARVPMAHPAARMNALPNFLGATEPPPPRPRAA